MKLKTCHRLVFKLHTKQLKRANWNLQLDLQTAMAEQPDCIISLNDSQALRFIDEINGVEGINEKASYITRRIKQEKKKPRSRETRANIRNLYEQLYNLQFQKDYICVVMDSAADYDRANKGFTVNGIRFRRFLGTNGGIKNSTIIYVSERIYDELMRRVDNGRDKTKELVPAKFEAYQALVCSGSVPLPRPRGFIVVHDCIAHFKDDVIRIDDEVEGEPEMIFMKDCDIEHNASDGYGLMSPEYSKRVNLAINGDGEHTISGMNTRYAWTKGMVYTFDFVEFAEKVAGSYIIQDVWGDPRDVRDADVILTESMLKLWDSYSNWEEYYRNCEENHYQFSTPKTTPVELEDVRDTNYQFLQSYEFTDDEIAALCQPTFGEIKEAAGLDYRKSLAFMCGAGIKEDDFGWRGFSPQVQALMAEPEIINDPYIRRKIWGMIEKRVEMAKRGAIRINANFAMISGDPYALCQSMFGLEVTGLLSRGEAYHKYWIDRGAEEIVCFRAPMTCANNITKMRLNKSNDVAHWFRYMETVMVYNAWDTSCEAMNGQDMDGDTNMCTDNPILLKCTQKRPTIICAQRKAAKCIPTEEDIVRANKLAFNDDIGVITNYVTSMFDVQSRFDKGSHEYEVLDYRIMCGQNYQQASIDRIKGIIAKPMPSYWYSYRDCGDDEFNRRIVASNKPYFMTYVYPALRAKNNAYIKNTNAKAVRLFSKYGIHNIDDLYARKRKTKRMKEFIYNYEEHMTVGNNPCTVNRICWLAEQELGGLEKAKLLNTSFDYSIMKSNVGYSRDMYNKIYNLYQEYIQKIQRLQKRINEEKTEKYIDADERYIFLELFKKNCQEICTNEYELCDIVLDICYRKGNMKSFAWDVCGDTIVENLLKRNSGVVNIPVKSGDGEFSFGGNSFVMVRKEIASESDSIE